MMDSKLFVLRCPSIILLSSLMFLFGWSSIGAQHTSLANDMPVGFLARFLRLKQENSAPSTLSSLSLSLSLSISILANSMAWLSCVGSNFSCLFFRRYSFVSLWFDFAVHVEFIFFDLFFKILAFTPHTVNTSTNDSVCVCATLALGSVFSHFPYRFVFIVAVIPFLFGRLLNGDWAADKLKNGCR